MPDKVRIKTSTVRNFSGGLNTTDNPKNLASKYLPLCDNASVNVDGSLSPRFGTQLEGWLKLPTDLRATVTGQAVTFTTYVASRVVSIIKTGIGTALLETNI